MTDVHPESRYVAMARHSTLAKRPTTHAVGLFVRETDANSGENRTHDYSRSHEKCLQIHLIQ
jgi:hypothetical protein